VVALGEVQPVGPVLVGGVDGVAQADDPHPGIHRCLEHFARLRRMAVEPTRFLGNDEVNPMGLDGPPHLVDARPVGDLAADLGLPDVANLNLAGRPALRQVLVQEMPADRDLVVEAGLLKLG